MTLTELMKQVVGFLPGWAWCGEAADLYWNLIHTETGAEVGAWLGTGGYENADTDRIVFYLRWPTLDSFTYHSEEPEWSNRRASISGSRTPEAIARDLKRRMLDGYPERYTEMEGARDERQADRDRARATAAGWARRFGGKVSQHDPNTFQVYAGGCSLTLEVTMKGDFNIKQSGWLSAEVGDVVLRALQDALVKGGFLTMEP